MKKILALALISLVLLSSVFAQGGSEKAVDGEYPTKAVEAVMCAAAGGGTDRQVRALAPFFAEYFGQQLVPVASPGGSGTIGMTKIANSPADGYTIGIPYTGGVCIMPAYGQTTYDKDSFRYVCQYSNSPIVLAVNAHSDIKNIDDLIELGKKDTVFYSCAANGAIDLAVQSLAMILDIDLVNVPTEGAAPAITNLLGNQVQIAAVHPANIYQYIESGDILPVLIFEAERYATLPDVPTATEIGADMVVSVWNGIAVPKNTPDDIYNKLVEGFAEIVKDPELKASFDKIGSTIDYLSPAELEAKIEKESKMFASLIESKKNK